MLYKSTFKLIRVSIALFFIPHLCFAARVYVKNWSSSTVTITNIIIEPSAGENIDTVLKKSTIAIYPGHNQQITVTHNDVVYNNMSKFTITYHLQEHTETETVYFPASSDQETSFYFTDSGYDRFPYNTNNMPSQGN